ncbi:MAG: hypothetical protein MN733_03250 [Nitrososphaera sp.]|nr:hypothetical protein [Nitrososphaera sp.]
MPKCVMIAVGAMGFMFACGPQEEPVSQAMSKHNCEAVYKDKSICDALPEDALPEE